MKNVFITGGAGFIGSRLARKLKQDFNVTIFDNFSPQVHVGNDVPADWLDGITVIKGDVRNESELTDAIKRTDPFLVYHLAAETGTGQSFDEPTRYNAVNIMGTTHLIEALRAHAPNLKRIVLAGSRSVYGEGACVNNEGLFSAAAERLASNLRQGLYEPYDIHGNALKPVATHALNCPVAPASVYASTKLMQEYLLKQAFWGTGVEIGILRLQNVYGPGQSLNNPYTGVISIFRRQIEEGKRLNIFEDGLITRDFVYVNDVVNAFAAIGLNEVCPEKIIDIGSGEATTIINMAKSLMVLLGKDPDNLSITGDFRAGDIRYAVADITDAQTLLNWNPTVSLAQGLEEFISWQPSVV